MLECARRRPETSSTSAAAWGRCSATRPAMCRARVTGSHGSTPTTSPSWRPPIGAPRRRPVAGRVPDVAGTGGPCTSSSVSASTRRRRAHWQRRGVVVDVTAMREAERRASQLVNVVDSIPLGPSCELADLDPPSACRGADLACGGDLRRPHRRWSARRRPAGGPGGRRRAAVPGLADAVRPRAVAGRPFAASARRQAVERVPRSSRCPATPGLALEDITERTRPPSPCATRPCTTRSPACRTACCSTSGCERGLRAEPDGGRPRCWCMDLDQFKEVNDALGHHHGDRLLIELSRRLQTVVRDGRHLSPVSAATSSPCCSPTRGPTAAIAVAKRSAAARAAVRARRHQPPDQRQHRHRAVPRRTPTTPRP